MFMGNRARRISLSTRVAAGLIGASIFAGVPGLALAQPQKPAAAPVQATDQVIFKNGRIVEGKVLEETATKIKMVVIMGGLSVETEYEKSEILSVKKDAIAPKAADADTATDGRKTGKPSRSATPANPVTDGARVYTIHLKGWFGEEISQTPIRDAVEDAKQYEPDYLVVIMENDWDAARFGGFGEIKEDVEGFFDQLFRAEDMDPIFTAEIPRQWSKPPKVVFWVKRAMGGAAFLPLICKDIYFSSEGKLGGIGGLENNFGSMGDEMVREKQFSLRLGHAEGMAITGGYDPKLIRAFARTDYVLSVGFEGGKPVFHEGMPRAERGEILLTDDGKEQNADTIQALARGEGNDNLTLNADLAYKIGLSRGTVDSFEDLMRELGIARTYTKIEGKSDQIMENWRENVEKAKRDCERIWSDFSQVAVGGDWAQRNAARGRQLRLLADLEKILKRYEEAINAGEIGVPGLGDIGVLRERIRLEQMRDRK